LQCKNEIRSTQSWGHRSLQVLVECLQFEDLKIKWQRKKRKRNNFAPTEEVGVKIEVNENNN
jgi:hypothetical protein